MEHTGQLPVMDEPSRRVCRLVVGEEYIDFIGLSERIRGLQKMSQKERDSEIVRLGLLALREKVSVLLKKSGSPFINAAEIQFGAACRDSSPVLTKTTSLDDAPDETQPAASSDKVEG